MIVFDDTLPDMWGNAPGSPPHGTPPEGDPYWEDRKHPHFNSEVYWSLRETAYWFEVAKSFYQACGGPECCPFNARTLLAAFTPFFEEPNNENE